MVECLNTEKKEESKIPAQKRVRFMWDGCRLPSQMCCLNVLSYLDYRLNIQKLVVSLNSAGKHYYDKMIAISPTFRDNMKLIIPPKFARVHNTKQ